MTPHPLWVLLAIATVVAGGLATGYPGVFVAGVVVGATLQLTGVLTGRRP